MRGATPYALRGTPLAIPNGTLANPALRFGRERSGLYRVGDGVVGVVVKAFKALDITQPMTTVSSSATGLLSPLSLNRINAAADGDETQLSFREIGVLVAKSAVYRQGAGLYGFKWYGRDAGGIHATPALTLDSTKRLTVAGLLIGEDRILAQPSTATTAQVAANNLQPNQHARVYAATNADGQRVNLDLSGSAGGFGLAQGLGGAALYTTANAPLVLGTANTRRILLDGSGNGYVYLPTSGMLNVVRNIDSGGIHTIRDDGNWNHRFWSSGAVFTLMRSVDAAPIMQVFDSGGLNFKFGSGGAINFLRSTDGGVALAINDTGLHGAYLVANSVDGTKITADTITATQLAPNSVTASELADGAVDTAALNGRAVGTENLVFNAIHLAARAYTNGIGGFSFGAGAWTPIPGLATPGFNPTNTHMWLVLAAISCSHSTANGRVILRLCVVPSTLANPGVPTGPAQQLWQGSYTSHATPGGWISPTLMGLVNPGSWLTSLFRIEAYSPDGGTVTVYGEASFSFWEVAR